MQTAQLDIIASLIPFLEVSKFLAVPNFSYGLRSVVIPRSRSFRNGHEKSLTSHFARLDHIAVTHECGRVIMFELR